MAAEGDPYASLLVPGNRLQEEILVHHFQGKVHAKEIVSRKMPKTTCPGKPERVIRCAVGKRRNHLREMTLGFAAKDMIEVRFVVGVRFRTDPYRPMVISNYGEIQILRCFFREFLPDQRGIEESMYTACVSEPDISFTVHQRSILKMLYVIGFSNRWGRLVLAVTQAVFWKAHQTELVRGGNPNTAVSINDLIVLGGDRVSG